MPWRSLDVVSQRTEFVLKSLDNGVVFRDLCQEYGISPKTGYKWQKRFFEDGLSGLQDQSRRPKSHPKELEEKVVCELIRLKTLHPNWGPRKIRELYRRVEKDAPSESSVKRVLDKAGLVRHRRRRRQRPPRGPRVPVKATAPNQVWTVDFKGWWPVAQRQRCEPLTIRDEFSRYLLGVRAMNTSKSVAVKQEFERVFERYGLPQIIRSDNGAPFAASRSPLGLSKLSAWWVVLGIDLDRIDPGHPEQNGGHERMHLDIRRDLQGSIEGGIDLHQAAFDVWKQEFNWQRPHEALEMKVPGVVYRRSEQQYESTPDDIEYPIGYLPRRVNPAGAVWLKGGPIFLSASLTGWSVGLRPVEQNRMEVWFDHLRLGEIDLRARAVIWADQPRLQQENNKQVLPVY